MVVLTDDEDRENEGDLILPAQFVTPEAITFMLSVARGYMCLSLTSADCDRLDLHAQAPVNTSARGTPFTVSIDGHPRHGFTTGVSARERAKTILMAIDPDSRPGDFVRPGHINPLRSRDGGVLVRTGQTEGSLDLCRLAGLKPAAIIIEMMRDDGEMARLPDLVAIAKKHDLKLCSVAQIIQHRLASESLVKRVDPASGTTIRTREGEFNLIAFESVVDPLPHIALTTGGVGMPGGASRSEEATLVRMHRESILGDIFGDAASSPEGSTGETLRASMRAIQRAGRGAIVYLRTEGVPIDAAGGRAGAHAELEQRLRRLRRGGFERGAESLDLTHPDGLGAQAVPMHQRDFGIGVQVLRDLGLRRLRLLSDHERALPMLDAFGLEIVERVPVPRD